MNILPTLILLILLSLFCILYLKEYLENRRFKKDPTTILDENRFRAFDILHEAAKKAGEIISEAELQGIKIEANSKIKAQSLEEVQQKIITQAQNDFGQYLQALIKQANQSQMDSEQTIKQKVNNLLEIFEQNLSNFLTQTQQKSTQALDLELKSARELIDTYKIQQFKLIDENIIAMLEKTISLVLNQKLSLKDQLELVYESLEKAKAEKFIL